LADVGSEGVARQAYRYEAETAVIPHLPVAVHPVALVYGDPVYRAMIELEARVVHLGRIKGALGAFARHPIIVLQVVIAVCRLPVLEVIISARQAMAWRSLDFYGVSVFPGRFAQAVLDLGPDDEAYLAGRRKQALRTNLNHARRWGLQAKTIGSYDEWAALATDILRSRPDGEIWIEMVQRPPATDDMQYFVAVDDAGRPLAFNVTAVMNDCAVLIWSASASDHPSRSAARYMLHTFMRTELRCRGVQQLIAGRTRGSPGLQYFQHLLGYEVRNLRITVRDAIGVPARSGEHPDQPVTDAIEMHPAPC
jgi:hypothetical protein